MQGQVNTFGGLRGDAKTLFKKVKSGEEGRVRIYRVGETAGSKAVQQKFFESAAVVVWCCGYSSNVIPFEVEYEDFDIENKDSEVDSGGEEKKQHETNKGRKFEPVELEYDGSQVMVDGQARVHRGNFYTHDSSSSSLSSFRSTTFSLTRVQQTQYANKTHAKCVILQSRNQAAKYFILR